MVAIALVSLVLDLTKSIAAAAWITTSSGQLWFDISPSSLNAAQAGIQRHVSPLLWDPVLQWLLTLPPWVIFGPIGLLILWAGDRKHKLRTSLL
ncbi:hypothetical protein E1162_10435 [Rhodobacteraceae bacterium RKSG542]|nr:hypothetical protein [Pseudovibrio flavus]